MANQTFTNKRNMAGNEAVIKKKKTLYLSQPRIHFFGPVPTLLAGSQQRVFVSFSGFLSVSANYGSFKSSPSLRKKKKVSPISLPDASTVNNSTHMVELIIQGGQVEGWVLDNNCSKNNKKAVVVCFVLCIYLFFLLYSIWPIK